MNEYVEVQLWRGGQPLKVARQLPNQSIELDEPDPVARRVSIVLVPSDDITRYRTRRIQQLRGWAPGELRLKMAAEGGTLVLRGEDPLALPEGRYQLRVGLEDAKTKARKPRVTLVEDGFCEFPVDVQTDDRQVSVDLTACDPAIGRVLDASSVDALGARDWLKSDTPRAARKACLLNLLASLRARPTVSEPLVEMVDSVYWVSNDRVYARVDAGLLGRLETLALHPKTPFYREGRPKADIHKRLVASIPADDRTLFSTEGLLSFRGEGSPSLQVVVTQPAPGHPVAYAEFDLDLGNALQDVVGFVVHMGELAGGKETDHLDLCRTLAGRKAKTRDYLYYTVVG